MYTNVSSLALFLFLEMVSNNGPQFISVVWENLMERLTTKYRFTTLYKLSTNGLVEQTNKTFLFYNCKRSGNKGKC